MSRPLIAITSQRYPVGALYKIEPAFSVIADYVDAVWRAGGMPVPVFPVTVDENGTVDESEQAATANADRVLESIDGVVIIGGLDVDPSRYGQPQHETVRPAPTDQEEFDLAMIRGAIDRKIPMLAICRGTQLVNVALGGSLHQHIGDTPGLLPHGIPSGGGGATNSYQFTEGSLVAQTLGATTSSGRCHHHQAIDEVAPTLIVTGRTSDDIIEVVELANPESWMLAVQWHPEETAASDPQNQMLFDGLVKAAVAATSLTPET